MKKRMNIILWITLVISTCSFLSYAGEDLEHGEQSTSFSAYEDLYIQYLLEGETCVSDEEFLKKGTVGKIASFTKAVFPPVFIGNVECFAGLIGCLTVGTGGTAALPLTGGSSAIPAIPLAVGSLIIALDGIGRFLPLIEASKNHLNGHVCHTGWFGLDDSFVFAASLLPYKQRNSVYDLINTLRSESRSENGVVSSMTELLMDKKNAIEISVMTRLMLVKINAQHKFPALYKKLNEALNAYEKWSKAE